MNFRYSWRRQLCCSGAWVFIPVIFVSLLFPIRAHAEGITVRKSEARANFPQNITFLLVAENAVEIDRVTLIYGVTTESCFNSQARHDMEFQPAVSVDLKWGWDLFRSGDLPPGVEIWWQWEIHAADGSSFTTEVQKQIIEDTYFQWKKLQSGPVSLYWSSGNNAFGQTLLNIAVSSIDRLSTLAGLTSESGVKIYIYPSAEDMKSILAHTTEWMGGVAFPEHRVILIGIAPTNLDWAKQVIPHELAHLEMKMRTFNCLSQGIPSWFNEGMAEFAEGPVPEYERNAINEMLKKDSLQSLVSLAEGFPADPRSADLAYMQSRQVVTFMIETYGQEKMQALLNQLQSGENMDPALRSVFGLDTNGMDQTWQASLGFGTAPEPNFTTATPAQKGTAIPTLALMRPFAQATETPTQTPSPTNTNTATVAVVAVSTITAATGVPTSTAVLLATESVKSSPAPNQFPWFLVGGTAALLLVIFLVWYFRSVWCAKR
jgi:hypothetical protein